MPVKWSLVPHSFLQGNYVLSRDLMPLSACFPPAPMLPSKAACGQAGGGPLCFLWEQAVLHGSPKVAVGQQPLMAAGWQRAVGAEQAESTSPLLRGFSSQWGGGCLPQPESPSNPPAHGLLLSPPAKWGRLAGAHLEGLREEEAGQG